MKILLSNPDAGRNITVEASDEFCANPENITVIINFEQYKLVSTKTEADKECEALAQKFANEHFFECRRKKLTQEQVKAEFKQALQAPEYAELVAKGNVDWLIMSLITSYQRYVESEDKIDAVVAEIKATMIDPEVQFDYIARYKRLLDTATTLREFQAGVMTIKNYIEYDDRVLLSDNQVTSGILPMLEKMVDTIHELQQTNNKEDILKTKIFNDPDYYRNQLMEARLKSHAELDKLNQTWRELEKHAKTPRYSNKFVYYLEQLSKTTTTLLDTYRQLEKLIRADNDAVGIERYRTKAETEFTQYFERMINLELEEHFDTFKYNNDDEEVFIDIQFGRFNQLSTRLTQANKDPKLVGRYLTELRVANEIYQKLIAAPNELAALLNPDGSAQPK